MGKQLHIVLFPAMAQGHMIPMLDMANLFISKGLKITIISTPAFSGPVSKARPEINLVITPFPPPSASLPQHIVAFDQMTLDLLPDFLRAMELLQAPLEAILDQLRPDCLVSDMFLPWTAASTAKFHIPRLAFYGTSFFARCLSEQLELRKPFKNVKSDDEPFLVPDLPDKLEFVRSQLSPFQGEIVNSFYELEPAYSDHYKNVIGRKAWEIGPLLLCMNEEEGEKKKVKSQRGKESAIDEHECLSWLDSRNPNSVVYVCFGSVASFSGAQLHETAAGLEKSGQDFIWVVRRGIEKMKEKEEEEGDEEDWLPRGFEERVRNRGLIIRGWAPQVMILDHPAVGAFVTHCGWNSTLEGLCAGVPMVTWPIFAEQFFNEKLVTEVLGTGVSVGNKRWQMGASEGVGREAVAEAVGRVMGGGGAAEMRSKAKYYKEMAKKAVGEGGSSYNNLNALIEELSN